jgi:pSer/pThr/pTyr-binding forkhead associated (FHA) protein
VPLLAASTNYSAIVRPLQWLVIALIFLFFLRVIRAVWVEMRPAVPRTTRADRRAQRRQADAVQARPSRRELHLEIVEPEDLKGRSFRLDSGELVIGRAPSCDVATTHDVYSSSRHARVYLQGSQLWVEDLGSTNGTFVNSERISRQTRLGRGDVLQVGGTVFEVMR